MILRVITLLSLLINTSFCSFESEEDARAYLERSVLSAPTPILPDGRDIDGNIVAVSAGTPFTLQPHDDRTPFEELRKEIVKKIVIAQRQFFAEESRQRKLQLRDKLLRLEICDAVLGSPFGWRHLGMMVNDPEEYLTKQQRKRHDYFVKQADLYSSHAMPTDTSTSFFSPVFSWFFRSNPAHKYEKID